MSKLAKGRARTHVLKTWPSFFGDMLSGAKTFELRKDDRGFEVGEKLDLREWDPTSMDESKFTGRRLSVRISYILRDSKFGLATGYCIMGIEFLGEA